MPMRSASVSAARLFGSVTPTIAMPWAAAILPAESEATPTAITPSWLAMATDIFSAV